MDGKVEHTTRWPTSCVEESNYALCCADARLVNNSGRSVDAREICYGGYVTGKLFADTVRINTASPQAMRPEVKPRNINIAMLSRRTNVVNRVDIGTIDRSGATRCLAPARQLNSGDNSKADGRLPETTINQVVYSRKARKGFLHRELTAHGVVDGLSKILLFHGVRLRNELFSAFIIVANIIAVARRLRTATGFAVFVGDETMLTT